MKKKKLHHTKSTGFKVPNNYFEEVEDSILSKLRFDGHANHSGLKAPDGYFDTLEDEILKKIEHKPKVVSLLSKRNLLFASGIAAALILAFNINRINTVSFDSLSQETVDNYLLDEITTDDLALLLDDTDFSEASFIDYDLNEEDLNYYLETVETEALILE